jgi:ACT domain-containing protein
MARVVSHAEVEAVPEGGVLRVEPDALVTPLARERAEQRGVQIELGEAPPPPSLVRQVARQVVARLPQATPDVIEAVVAEILGSLGDGTGRPGERLPIGGPEGPPFDICAACVEAERARSRARGVLSVTGRNQRGTAAMVTAALTELGADILDISQTIVADFFTMIVVFDTRPLELPFDEAREVLEQRLAEHGMRAAVMHEDVLSSLHRV